MPLLAPSPQIGNLLNAVQQCWREPSIGFSTDLLTSSPPLISESWMKKYTCRWHSIIQLLTMVLAMRNSLKNRRQRKIENANDHASAVPWHHNGQAQPEAGIGQNLGDAMWSNFQRSWFYFAQAIFYNPVWCSSSSLWESVWLASRHPNNGMVNPLRGLLLPVHVAVGCPRLAGQHHHLVKVEV